MFEVMAIRLLKKEEQVDEERSSFPRIFIGSCFVWWSAALGIDQLVADVHEEAV